LARQEVLALFGRPLFAAASDDRFYLNGIFLHTSSRGLTAVATDGHRLARVTLPGAVGLSDDRRLIVPRASVRLIIRLLGDKRNERIVLRRSATLLAVEAATFTFMSKLVDADFPGYECVIAAPSGNAITVDRKSLVQSVARIAAVTDPQVKAPLVGLSWQPDEPVLHLCPAGYPDAAADVITAETSGTGHVALRIRHVAELLDEIEGERVHLDINSAQGPVLITDPDDADYLAVQMPCSWPFEKSQAA
jgi:DNA polymerase-3 subunit beta